jgi:tryptophan-rich hypothetical protein
MPEMNPQLKPARNRMNPDQLLLSKWTAAAPENREKHFLVTKVYQTEESNTRYCLLEAVLTRSEYRIEWRELQDATRWLAGWR